MDPATMQLAKSAAFAARRYAIMAAGGYFIIDMLSKIPIVGLLFFCLNGLVVIAAYIGVGYLVTPGLFPLPALQSKSMVGLGIGGGVAAVVTAAFLVAVLIAGIIGVVFGSALGGGDNAFGSLMGGMLWLVIRLLFTAIAGLIIGTGLAFLGSYFALERNKSLLPSQPF